MKILTLTKWFIRRNGASRVAYELSKRFKKEHEVRIAAYKNYIDPEWEKEFEMYKLTYKGPLALMEIRKAIKEFKPDIIHSHGILGWSSVFSNIPIVTTTHSNWPMNWLFSPIDFIGGIILEIPHDFEMRLSNKVVSVSKYQQEKLRNRGIKSEVIYNGIDESFFQPSENQFNLKHPCVLFVGGIDKRKAKYLVPLIKLIRRRNNGGIHIYLIGKAVDVNIVEKLKNIDNVHYLGVVEDVKPYYQNADVLVFTSRVEIFGLVPVEAQACGCPVVTFNVGALPELVKNEETGFLVEPFDIGSMVDRAFEILYDADLRRSMGKNGIKNVKENFLWDDKVKKYINLFNSLVEECI